MNPNKKLVPITEAHIFEAKTTADKEDDKTSNKLKEFIKLGFSKRQAKDLCEKGVSVEKAEKLNDAENEAFSTIGGQFKYLMGGMSKEAIQKGKIDYKKKHGSL